MVINVPFEVDDGFLHALAHYRGQDHPCTEEEAAEWIKAYYYDFYDHVMNTWWAANREVAE